MKLVFSRKGFDSGSGGGPSPIVNGRPISVPIPGVADPRAPTYADLGLGEHARIASRGRVGPGDHCHHDPFFADGQCAFGQADAAQSHLANQGVGVGDVFLFFGLFAGDGMRAHHRIFATMWVAQLLSPACDGPPSFAPHHPHFWGELASRAYNSVYVGPASVARSARPELQLTAPDQPLVSRWKVPAWLHRRRRQLSYHGADWRWEGPDQLRTVGRGQEFVIDISSDAEATAWLAHIVALIERD